MTVTDLLNRANRYTAMALPAAAAGTLFTLILYHALQRNGTLQSQTVWFGFMPEWFSGVVALITAAVFIPLGIYLKARNYPTAANVATISGIATTCALIWWPTQQCSQIGGLTAGLTLAGMVVVTAMGINCQAGRVRRGIVIDDGAVVDQPNDKSEAGRMGAVTFAQIFLATIMAIVVLIAFTNDDVSESRTKLLMFAGIGITAASLISTKLNLKNILAIAGAVISVVGAYLEMDQALTSSSSEIGALTILIAAGLVAGIAAMFMSLDAQVRVRLVVTPILVGLAAGGVTLLITLVPVVLISSGCGVPTMGTAVSVLASGLLAVIAGSATFAVLTGIAAHDWRKSKKRAPQQGQSE